MILCKTQADARRVLAANFKLDFAICEKRA